MSAPAYESPPAAPARTRYEDDLYTWVQEQVALLRAGRLDGIDAANGWDDVLDRPFVYEPMDRTRR